MDKKKLILQRHLSISDESANDYLILIEIEEGLPVRNYLVPIPKSFYYYNEHYPYYMINSN